MDYRDCQTRLASTESIPPDTNQSGNGTVNGAAVQNSVESNDTVVQAHCSLHNVTGSPTAVSAVFSIEESEDGSTGWAACAGQSNLTLDADGESGFCKAMRQYEYTRVSAVLTFTGGTTPAADVGSHILDRKRDAP